MQSYSKPALSLDQQLEHLRSKGLIIRSDGLALSWLRRVSYYRLRGYLFPFLEASASSTKRLVTDGTTLEDVIEVYEFDRKLRLLVLEGLEAIEISIRTQLTHEIATIYGPLAYRERAIFHPGFKHGEWLAKIDTELTRSRDAFIEHFRNTYSDFPSVPVWMLTEVLSFGSLSLFYRGLGNDGAAESNVKKRVAGHYGVHYKTFESWLHSLTYVRNICAHHSRLWNRKLAIKGKRASDEGWLNRPIPPRDKIFHVILILHHLIKQIGQSGEWESKVTEHLSTMAALSRDREAMGMPEDWASYLAD